MLRLKLSFLLTYLTSEGKELFQVFTVKVVKRV
jgi:hypothetical protein